MVCCSQMEHACRKKPRMRYAALSCEAVGLGAGVAVYAGTASSRTLYWFG
jgi:hypothetical protein